MSLLHPGKVDAQSLHVLLAHELKDLYDAEHQIVDALPKVIEQVTNPDLKKVLEHHLEETKNHVTRLEDCFNMLEMKPERMHCDGMEGVLKEGKHVLDGDMEASIKDEALIGACQRVEHYEMAAYGCAREHAKNLGFKEISKLLDSTLQEEGKADHALTAISAKEHEVLAKAMK
jgi:ferritin-like metal-binding protein YciE